MKKPLIFISCGQFTDEERMLGRDLCDLVRELTPYEPYFAENQTTLEGMSNNILSALNQSSGLLAIMHPRGEVSSPSGAKHIRASVWIEQEIAIAAFLTQAQGRSLPVLAYIHKSIEREGVRDKLLLNARRFASNEEILADLRRTLPGWEVESLESEPPLEVSLTYERLTYTAAHHNYRLSVGLTNVGTEVIRDFHADLLFPTALLKKDVNYALELPSRRTATHSLFRVSTASHQVNALHPGDPNTILTVDYYVDSDLFKYHPEVLKQMVTVTIYVKGSPPLSEAKSVSELQNF